MSHTNCHAYDWNVLKLPSVNLRFTSRGTYLDIDFDPSDMITSVRCTLSTDVNMVTAAARETLNWTVGLWVKCSRSSWIPKSNTYPLQVRSDFKHSTARETSRSHTHITGRMARCMQLTSSVKRPLDSAKVRGNLQYAATQEKQQRQEQIIHYSRNGDGGQKAVRTIAAEVTLTISFCTHDWWCTLPVGKQPNRCFIYSEYWKNKVRNEFPGLLMLVVWPLPSTSRRFQNET